VYVTTSSDIYVGNTYGAGVGTSCLNDVQCTGTETSFVRCNFNIKQINRATDRLVKLHCFDGMILTVSATVEKAISIVRL